MKITRVGLLSKIFIALIMIIFISAAFAVQISAEEAEDVIGDVYADGEVTIKDAIFLKQYLKRKLEISNEKLYIANTYVEDNCDNAEFNITDKDLVSILKYLTKEEITLGIGKWHVLSEPTEDTSGKATRCVAKGNEDIELSALNEDTYEVKIIKRPSCTEQGEKEYKHRAYNEIKIKKDIAMLEHTVVEDNEIAPTCTENGKTQGSHCSACNTTIVAQEIIPALGHSFLDISWKCSVCESDMYNECESYEEFRQLCNVAENGNLVTLHYDGATDIGLNLHLFNLDVNKTYVFFFGANAGNVKINANGNTYGNVRVEIGPRDREFNLNLQDVGLVNYNTVIHSSAQTLNLGFYGEACSISTTKGIDGADGIDGEYIALSEINGRDGGNANTAIYCGSGVLNVACGANTSIVGGNGGNGGNGGDYVAGFGSFYGDGGNGGNGGSGAKAIEAGAINAFFILDKTRDNLYIVGGSGGSGGIGGNGVGIGDGVDGEAGQPGASASRTNVEIAFVE